MRRASSHNSATVAHSPIFQALNEIHAADPHFLARYRITDSVTWDESAGTPAYQPALDVLSGLDLRNRKPSA